MEITVNLLAIVILLAANGFFVAAGFALVKARGFRIFSSLHIVVGEQVPKTLAVRKAEPVSLCVAYPLHFSIWHYFHLTGC